VDTDATIRSIADKQLHLVTTKQLLDAGLSRGQIHRRLNGSSVHPGVFLVAGAVPSFEQRALAAALACGPGAFISSVTAAALWPFIDGTDEIHITVPADRNPRPAGIFIHRSSLVGFPHSASLGVFPIATPARTLLDCAGALTGRRLELAVDQAVRSRRISTDRLVAYLERRDIDRFQGVGDLRAIARDRMTNGTPESALETLALRVLRDSGLPQPVRQYSCTIGGRRVRFDLAYPERRIAIELDGRAPHLELDTWQSDHDRHNAIEGSGWIVLRFTWHDITQRPTHVIVTVANALQLQPNRWFSVAPKRFASEER
jgi:very-short-patch-repair endonuclease